MHFGALVTGLSEIVLGFDVSSVSILYNIMLYYCNIINIYYITIPNMVFVATFIIINN